jgi:hypothetical protein
MATACPCFSVGNQMIFQVHYPIGCETFYTSLSISLFSFWFPMYPTQDPLAYQWHFPLVYSYVSKTELLNFLWTLSTLYLSFCVWGSQTQLAYSNFGLIIVMYISSFTSFGQNQKFRLIIPRVFSALFEISEILSDNLNLSVTVSPILGMK